MSATVLFDTPGPKARARSKAYTGITGLALAALLGWIGYRFWVTGQFDASMWARFEYTDVQWAIVQGLLTTLKVFAIAGAASLVLGAVLAVGRLSDHAPVRWVSAVIVEFFRAMPLVIMIYALYRWQFTDRPMWALVIGLTLYNGSVQAEVIRAGINAVPRGQAEAAYALGLRKSQVMRVVLVPQAVRSMLPTIISQLVVTLKDTSLGYVITYEELLYVGNQIAATTNTPNGFPYVQVMMVIAPIYIAMCLLLSWAARAIERRGGRTTSTGAALAGAGMAAGD
ncbi:amino acid ABC transporter permease [Mangrovactinospora gilvigrisea]|uniref:Amino acid ABC transporter permease n=1 Tax=Mangrovactinospora gilvigrisea TaxID=1428644 RepID=A0A1J7BCN5_9ACTN|nr:amino acid ABC transporter permease [Mangrovactinospora gilvigrisea]OIV36463.1 amino acid ABC transporter permease [Mangrovactinospora gilvigrisea]